jgi:hypothetical protein
MPQAKGLLKLMIGAMKKNRQCIVKKLLQSWFSGINPDYWLRVTGKHQQLNGPHSWAQVKSPHLIVGGFDSQPNQIAFLLRLSETTTCTVSNR